MSCFELAAFSEQSTVEIRAHLVRRSVLHCTFDCNTQALSHAHTWPHVHPCWQFVQGLSVVSLPCWTDLGTLDFSSDLATEDDMIVPRKSEVVTAGCGAAVPSHNTRSVPDTVECCCWTVMLIPSTANWRKTQFGRCRRNRASDNH